MSFREEVFSLWVGLGKIIHTGCTEGVPLCVCGEACLSLEGLGWIRFASAFAVTGREVPSCYKSFFDKCNTNFCGTGNSFH